MRWLKQYTKPLVGMNLIFVASFIAMSVVTYSTNVSLFFVFKLHLGAMIFLTSFAILMLWMFIEEGK